MPGPVAIRLENLTKTFGRREKKRIVAVNNVNLDIDAGQVYGFLGPNGAGKTTTIRMMLSLMRPTAGQIYIFDKPIRGDSAVLRRVGAAVEGAAFYPYLSGCRNLEVIARINGYYDAERVDRLLRQVGLDTRARQRFRGYSLGMKQRLGLAAALLNDPDLLIMDEPTNGLDPAGIQEMRHFLRELIEQHGKTVFLSSHLLNEVEQMCDRVAIIHRGQILREGRIADLTQAQPRVKIEAAPVDQATAALEGHYTASANGGTITVDAAREEIPAVLRRLIEHGIEVYEVTPQRESLESFFLKVTAQAAAASGDATPQADHAGLEMTSVR
jgi:ABC-2 type transport system ATP-binding protein